MMYTAGAQCTANFVYTDAAGDTFVGYAAHCAGTGSQTDTNGCQTKSLPLGTKVTFTNDGNPASSGTTVGSGTLAYSSWLTEAQNGEKDANTCAYNDLALVKVDPADVGKVNPSVPTFGGPAGVKSENLAAGDKVAARSGLLDANGNAIGVLSTVALAPLAGSNNFGDLGKELAYAQANSGIAGLALATGTEKFSPAF